MQIYLGEWKTAVIANGDTSTSIIDMGMEAPYIHIRIPALDSCTLKVQVSNIPGGTFQDLGPSVTTKTTTGAFNDVWILGGWQYLKIVSSVAQTADRTFYIQGMRN